MSITKQQLWFYTRRALWVTLAWVLIFNTLFFFDYYTLLDNQALTSDFDFKLAFSSNFLVSVIAGILGGTVTLNVMEWSLRKYAFWKALLLIAFLYIAISIVISFIGSRYYFSDYIGVSIFDAEVTEAARDFFKSWRFIKNLIIWLFIVLGTLIVLMINDKYGPGVFPDYLKGKYFQPKREQRIFMFADIKDATTIAEAIGEEKYFNFLKDFFNDIAPAIMQSQGEVYQYVGDEVVITWKMKKGLRKANVLRCFYGMQSALSRKRNKYLTKYGHFPYFKVGIHCGAVMVGELGKIKRDIAFSGDVLNTTARIQAECNGRGVEILASNTFTQLLEKLPSGIEKRDIGDAVLKGKSEEVRLVTYVKGEKN